MGMWFGVWRLVGEVEWRGCHELWMFIRKPRQGWSGWAVRTEDGHEVGRYVCGWWMVASKWTVLGFWHFA